MLNYQSLKQNPQMFKRITSFTPAQFDHLLEKANPVWKEMENQRLNHPARKRAVGGGSEYTLALRERLLMTLIWLKLSLTTEALGIFLGVSKSTVSRNTRSLLPVIGLLSDNILERPTPSKRGQGKNILQALQAYPDLCDYINAVDFY